MTADEDFDLAKQLRIAARNRRISKGMIMHAEQHQCHVISAAAVGTILVLAMLMWGVVHVATY